jgi:methylthioribose-1-phosphate isomerase
VPFYVVAPRTSFDPAIPDGGAIPVEERSGREVLRQSGWPREERLAAFNPAFDVTPAEAITAWITDFGVEQPPFQF